MLKQAEAYVELRDRTGQIQSARQRPQERRSLSTPIQKDPTVFFNRE
jgi:hypothetical protein